MPVSSLQLGQQTGNLPPYTMKRWHIGHGDSAIKKTILHMQALVLGPEGVGHPEVRVAALEAARGAVKNLNEIDHVLEWVKKNIEFRGENAETLQSPVVTLQLRAGDCDDHSSLIAAMLRSLGYKVQFKTVATQETAPGQFSHVYVMVQDKRSGQWKGLDSTVPDSFAGWEPPVIYRQRIHRHRSLGDDSAPQFDANQQIFLDIAQPLVDAAASRIQYGSHPPMPMLSSPGAQALPSWVWLLGLGAVLYFVSQR